MKYEQVYFINNSNIRYSIWKVNHYSQEKPGYNNLTKEEAQVILKKGTEYPFTGKFEKFKGKGTYICRQCGAALYYSDSKV